MTPKSAYLGNINRDDPYKEKVFVLTRGDGGPIRPSLTPVRDQNFEAAITELEAGEKYELRIRAKPPWPNDRIRTSLRLSTGVPEAASDVISVYANITPLIAANPKRLTIPQESPTPVEREVRVRRTDNKPVRIERVSINRPELTATLEERHGEQVVVVRAPAGFEAGKRVVSNLDIFTDCKEFPKLTVSIFSPPQRVQNRAAQRARPGITPRRPATPQRPTKPARTSPEDLVPPEFDDGGQQKASSASEKTSNER